MAIINPTGVRVRPIIRSDVEQTNIFKARLSVTIRARPRLAVTVRPRPKLTVTIR